MSRSEFDRPTMRGVSHLVLVGCGGTGSHLIEPLARLLAFHPGTLWIEASQADGARVVLCDGDKFDDGNAARQMGCVPGAWKCEALAARVRGLFASGVVATSASYLDERGLYDLVQDMANPLVVLAVDNFRSRLEACRALTALDSFLCLLPGNELADGGVIAWHREHGRDLTPSPLAMSPDGIPLHPEITSPTDRMPGGCLEMAASSPQLISANALASVACLCLVQAYLDARPVPGEVRFDARKLRMRAD